MVQVFFLSEDSFMVKIWGWMVVVGDGHPCHPVISSSIPNPSPSKKMSSLSYGVSSRVKVGEQ